MEKESIIKQLRLKQNMSQDDLAGKLNVTRQAISRWETGETTPNPETLKQLSSLFHVSINTLLGSPEKLICQCCGMPLDEDALISQDVDGSLNEQYCKWCFHDGQFQYHDMNELIETCLPLILQNEPSLTETEVRLMMKSFLPQLFYWKKAPFV